MRPFAWRSTDTIEFIKLLDKTFHNNKSAQSKRQIKERVTGPFSTRERARNTLPTLACHVLRMMSLSVILYLVYTYTKKVLVIQKK